MRPRQARSLGQRHGGPRPTEKWAAAHAVTPLVSCPSNPISLGQDFKLRPSRDLGNQKAPSKLFPPRPAFFSPKGLEGVKEQDPVRLGLIQKRTHCSKTFKKARTPKRRQVQWTRVALGFLARAVTNQRPPVGLDLRGRHKEEGTWSTLWQDNKKGSPSRLTSFVCSSVRLKTKLPHALVVVHG